MESGEEIASKRDSQLALASTHWANCSRYPAKAGYVLTFETLATYVPADLTRQTLPRSYPLDVKQREKLISEMGLLAIKDPIFFVEKEKKRKRAATSKRSRSRSRSGRSKRIKPRRRSWSRSPSRRRSRERREDTYQAHNLAPMLMVPAQAYTISISGHNVGRRA